MVLRLEGVRRVGLGVGEMGGVGEGIGWGGWNCESAVWGGWNCERAVWGGGSGGGLVEAGLGPAVVLMVAAWDGGFWGFVL